MRVKKWDGQELSAPSAPVVYDYRWRDVAVCWTLSSVWNAQSGYRILLPVERCWKGKPLDQFCITRWRMIKIQNRSAHLLWMTFNPHLLSPGIELLQSISTVIVSRSFFRGGIPCAQINSFLGSFRDHPCGSDDEIGFPYFPWLFS